MRGKNDKNVSNEIIFIKCMQTSNNAVLVLWNNFKNKNYEYLLTKRLH